MCVERPETGAEMIYLKKKNIYMSIHQKLRKNHVYEIDMHKIYNLIMSQTNEQLHEKLASYATFKAFKTGWYRIGYLIILNNLYFLNQHEQHPIRSLLLVTRQLYNIVKHANNIIIYYLIRFRI